MLRATNVAYERVTGDLWAVTWTAYNRWVPEVKIRSGEIEVSPFASSAELEGAVRAAVYRADPLMWVMVDSWAVGERPSPARRPEDHPDRASGPG